MSRGVRALAQLSALAGGAVLLALIALTCVSVLGRAGLTLSALSDPGGVLSRLRPLRGDYELVEIGSAIAIFAFLPLSLTARAHASVDLSRGHLPAWLDRRLDRFWDALMAVVLAVIAWQLGLGTLAKRASGETTFLLQWPLWWAYAACLVFAVITAVTALWLLLAPQAPDHEAGRAA